MCCHPISVLQYFQMDFRFSVLLLECKVSVAAEHNALQIPTAGDFPLE
jgi:hypothetical protein